MLTTRQMVAIATHQRTPPFRLSGLSQMYRMKPLSLRSVRKLMEQQKSYFLCEVRDLSIMKGSTSYAQLQAAFAQPGSPSKKTLIQLSTILNAAGGSIKYVSKDWRRVGIAGTIQSLAGVHAYSIADAVDAIQTQAHVGSVRPEVDPKTMTTVYDGLAAAGAVLVLFGIVTGTGGTAIPVIAISVNELGALFAATGAVGIFTGDITASNSGASTPSGDTNLPLDPANAANSVVTNAPTGNVSDAINQPDVDPNNLAEAAPGVDDTGDPDFGDPPSELPPGGPPDLPPPPDTPPPD